MIDIDSIDPEEYVRTHEEQLKNLIRHSSDTFARACAWSLLDRYSENPSLDELQAEQDYLSSSEADS